MGFSLGSFAGGLSQGLQSEQQLAMQQALQKQQQAGQAAAGNALGGTMAQPQPNMLQGLLDKLTGGAQPQPGQPMQLPGATPSAGPMGGGAMPMLGRGGPPPQQPQQPPMPQQGGAPQPQQPAPPPQQGGAPPMGQLTLDNVVQRIKQFNPNLGPKELMSAVGQVLPIMNAQSQQQYKMIMTQLAPARLEVSRDSLDERTRHDKETEKLGGERVDNQKAEFDQRLTERVREYDTTLEQNYTKLQATNDRTEAAQLATTYRSAVRAKLAATQHEIAAANSFDPDQKKQLMEKAKADADAATAQLDEATKAMKERAAGRVTVTPNADGSKRTDKAPASTRAAPETAPAADTSTLLQQAKEAIAAGAPREAVLAKLKELGVAAPGL